MSIVRLDKIHAGVTGNLESVLVYTDDTKATLQPKFSNGLLVTLGDVNPEGKGREVHEAMPTTAETATGAILLVANTELLYDEKLKLDDYVNGEGQVVRAY